MLKTFSKKIPAITEKEELFMQCFNRTIDLSSSRNLISFFLNEDTSYPIAEAFAKSALNWLKEEYEIFQKFEKTLDFVVPHVEKVSFINYCAELDLNHREYKGLHYARGENGWNSIYNEQEKSLKIATENSLLTQLSYLNYFEGEE